MAVLHGHDKTTTVTAALGTTGLTARARFDGPTDGVCVLAYVTDTLVPMLKPGDTVMPRHPQRSQGAGVRETLAAAGARLYRPSCSPEFNPIVQALKLKHLLRSAAARTVTDL